MSLSATTKKKRPIVLSIAGHDPSGGAGYLADIKTFEQHKVYGMSICTAITAQNEYKVKKCVWIDQRYIYMQLDIILESYNLNAVKIGIIKNWNILNRLITKIKTRQPKTIIVWDPILRASDDFNFHEKHCQKYFENTLKFCNLLTPNFKEIQHIYSNLSIEQSISRLCQYTNVLVKGGHRENALGVDTLYNKNGTKQDIYPFETRLSKKHGSGCVLAASISSNLALGASLEEACKEAKKYITHFLSSTDKLLGYHKL